LAILATISIVVHFSGVGPGGCRGRDGNTAQIEQLHYSMKHMRLSMLRN
jgi:hypothetical protein